MPNLTAIRSILKSSKNFMTLTLLLLMFHLVAGNDLSVKSNITDSSQSHQNLGSSTLINASVPGDAQSSSRSSKKCPVEPCSDADTSISTPKLSGSNSNISGEVSKKAESMSQTTGKPVESKKIDGEVSKKAESMSQTTGKTVESKKMDPEALMRGFYVFAGLSVVVLVYIAWKSFGKRPSQIHKYGVVANREDLEMAPLDSDDGDEEDTLHFDINKHRLK